ncbi:MAG: nucleotidyltransferase substrate binding protein [Deltaproteobacteria bacterium]|nr:nucleotidyltransferase substrate binding protein [Deltaproteobacteria bacterium]
MESKKKKLLKAKKNLEAALKQYQQNSNELNFLTVVKTYEIVVEYAWRELKLVVEDEGLEAPSPKMAIKQAAKLNYLNKPEVWLLCIDARNNSVHDYFGISEKEYIELAKNLLVLMKEAKVFQT